MLNNYHNINKQFGFSLIEVMVSLVIFSIGLLGLAGLQQVGIAQNATAMQRTVAMSQAYDILDRMRNNRTTDYSSAASASAPNCITAACNTTQIASYDIYEWDLALASALPNGRGFITGTPAAYIVSVGWDENRAGLTPTGCNPAAPAGVKCISIQGRP